MEGSRGRKKNKSNVGQEKQPSGDGDRWSTTPAFRGTDTAYFECLYIHMMVLNAFYKTGKFHTKEKH